MTSDLRSSAAPVARWLFRPHLPHPAHPAGLPGVLVITAAGQDRFFDVIALRSAGGSGNRVLGWHVRERPPGTDSAALCFQPGEESSGGWPYADMLRRALEEAGLPLCSSARPRWRSTGDFAANDPCGYAEAMARLADADEPGK